MTLLNKIVNTGIAENNTIKRLHDISYSAINGQRQEVKNYQPEGVVMLGQLNKEKPLEAITKEMILDYQEREKAPIMVEGEARVYAKPEFEPLLQIPTETKDIEEEAIIIMKNRLLTGRNIKEATSVYVNLIQAIDKLKTNINVFGLTQQKKDTLLSYERMKDEYLKEINKLKMDYERYTVEMNRRRDILKNIIKDNSLIKEQNKEEVKKYETEMGKVNRNRLNLQQQQYENDFDYYRRLKELEQTKYDPVLYKQYALNQNVKELKPKLSNIFKDTSFIEDILKTLSDEDKFKVNKNFDDIEKSFIKKYDYNPSMSAKQASQELTEILDELNSSSRILQSAIKRKQTDKLPDTEAIKSLQAVIKRNKIQKKFKPVLNKYRELSESANAIKSSIKQNQDRSEYFNMVYEKQQEDAAIAREEERNKIMEENITQSQLKAQQIAELREKARERLKAREETDARQKLQRQREEYIEYHQVRRKYRELIKDLNEYRSLSTELSPLQQEILANKKDELLKNYQILKELEDVKNREYSSPEEGSHGSTAAVQSQSEAFLSGATTAPQGILNPKRRTDIGVPRGSYNPTERAELKRIAKEKKKAEKASLKAAAKLEKELAKLIEESPAARTERREGEGIKRKAAARRTVKPQEKLKDRLRLVASQIEAGNTNPKLILEVNKLYKNIYDIDNAYQLLKK